MDCAPPSGSPPTWRRSTPWCTGSRAGYDRTFVARHDTILGLVPIGYGDGVPRALGNRGAVRIAGRRHPIVGAVSMDMLTADLGPTPTARIGDTVTSIGHGASAEDAANVSTPSTTRW